MTVIRLDEPITVYHNIPRICCDLCVDNYDEHTTDFTIFRNATGGSMAVCKTCLVRLVAKGLEARAVTKAVRG